jgi:hypothetical protein
MHELQSSIELSLPQGQPYSLQSDGEVIDTMLAIMVPE